MAKSSRPSNGSKESTSSKASKDQSTVRNSRTTVSGPAEPDASGRGDVTAEKAAAIQGVASAFTFNPNKAAEYDPDAALARHCKPILALGESNGLLETCGIDTTLPSGNADPGVLVGDDAASVIDDFVAAIAKHRHFARETDPPRV